MYTNLSTTNIGISERELFEQLLKGERNSYEAERRYQRTGEEPNWAKVTFSSVRDAEGQVRYVVAMIEEITEQKKAQENLVQSETRFRAMFDNTSVGIALTDLTGASFKSMKPLPGLPVIHWKNWRRLILSIWPFPKIDDSPKKISRK